MPKQFITVPPSTTTQIVEVEIPDTITQVIVTDIPNEFPYIIKGTTAPGVPEPPEPEDPATGYELTYSNGYDKITDLSPNQIGVARETDLLTKYFSTAITKDSPGSFKSIVPAGGNNLSNGNRSEQQYNSTTQTPVEGAYEYWANYENWDSARGLSGHTFQIHPHTSGASAVISLQNYGGAFEVVKSIRGVNTRIQNVTKKVSANTWIHHRWEIKFSTGTDGYCRLFLNNEKVCDYKGQTADGSGQYMKLGQNRWGDMNKTSVVYYDTLEIYELKQ
jgi:hypothetical protein